METRQRMSREWQLGRCVREGLRLEGRREDTQMENRYSEGSEVLLPW